MASTASEKLNCAALRLAAELRVEKLKKQILVDTEKALWEYHKTELEYAETLQRFNKSLHDAEKVQLSAVFQEQLQCHKLKLDGNRVKLDVVQKLVHQLAGRSQNFHINVAKLREEKPFPKIDAATEAVLAGQDDVFNENVVRELHDFGRQVDELYAKINQVQSNISEISEETMVSAADLIQDILS